MFSRLNAKIKRLLFSHGIFVLGRSAFQVFMNIFDVLLSVKYKEQKFDLVEQDPY